jgi:hypothetical protein
MKLLPARADGKHEYRIRDTEEGRDLVARESDLRAA